MLFLPYVLSIPVVGVVFSQLFQLDGTFNTILRSAGLGALGQDWLGSPTWALPTIMFVIVWKELGFGIILCLARLMSVDEQLFEAARVDGAGWWRVLRHVTIPQLLPALAFYAVVELITMLSWVFAYVGMVVKEPETAQVAGFIPLFPLVFASSAFVPVASMPGWLQGFARVQPVSVTVNSVRALTQGGPIYHWLWQMIVWTGLILVVFIPLAVARYRRI